MTQRRVMASLAAMVVLGAGMTVAKAAPPAHGHTQTQLQQTDAQVAAARAQHAALQAEVAKLEQQNAARQQQLQQRDAEIAALQQKLAAAGKAASVGH